MPEIIPFINTYHPLAMNGKQAWDKGYYCKKIFIFDKVYFKTQNLNALMSHYPLLKVFIADDDVMFGKRLSDHLSKNPGYEVSFFSTGEDCIKNLSSCPDAVVVDYHPAGENNTGATGLHILDEIKKFDPSIHVIMLCHLNHYGVAAQSISRGAEQCVIKDDDAFKNVDLILEDIRQENL